MQLNLSVTPEDVHSIAACLNADASGEGFDVADGDVRDNILLRIVAQAAFRYQLKSPAIAVVVERDYARFGNVSRVRRLPKSRRIAPR